MMRYIGISIFFTLLIFTRYIREIARYTNLDEGSIYREKVFVYPKPPSSHGYYVFHSGFIDVFVPDVIQIDDGDLLLIDGRISRKKNLVTNTNYDQIRLIGKYYSYIWMQKDSGIVSFSKLFKLLASTRGKLVKNLQFLFSQNDAGIINGILIGDSSMVTPIFYQKMVKLGIVHILSASGYNLEVMIQCFSWICVKYSRKTVPNFFLMIVICLYAAFAAFSASILRAAIMSLYKVFCLVMGREYIDLWSLFMASAILLLFRPQYVHDLGFLLSVSATLGLILLHPVLCRFISSEVLSTSLAASLATAPILLWKLNTVSLFGWLFGMFFLWMVPFLMLFGSIPLFLSCFSFNLSWLAAIPARILLGIFRMMVETLANLPFHDLSPQHDTQIYALIWTIGLFCIVFLDSQRKKKYDQLSKKLV